MLKTFLDYYLFDYEIEVYPKYTKLSDEMIMEKMGHFSHVLMDDGKKSILGIVASFYGENGETEKQCTSTETENKKITTFDEDPIVIKYSSGKHCILVLPYYLFENRNVTRLIKEMDKDRMDLFKSYKKYYDLKSSFIWREAFPANNIVHAKNKLDLKSKIFMKKNGHKKLYQKLYCLIIFKESADRDSKKQVIADSFALTIKEWGLDIHKQHIIEHGTRAAVAAIMGRNMSHNIGSHVLSYWSRWLKKESSLPNEQIDKLLGDEEKRLKNMPDLRTDEFWGYVEKLKNVNTRAFVRSENLKDISARDRWFFDYLRSRMDFIAEISTTDPAWASTLMFCQDIILSFVSQKVLLNYLVMSENIHFEPCIKLKCSDSAQHHRINIEVNYLNERIFALKYFSDELDLHYRSNLQPDWIPLDIEKPEIRIKDDIPISVPHGLTGIHAFYSILENFIRNSAKHGVNKLEGQAEFTIVFNIDDMDYNDLIKISISDNLGSCDKKVIEKIHGGLTETLVNKNGVINPGNWGLKEKKISACFLRMGGPKDVDKAKDFPPLWSKEAKTTQLLVPSCVTCRQSACCHAPVVSYEFYLMKPKEALIIGGLNDKKNEKLGIFSIKNDEFTDAYIQEGVPHRFLITSGNAHVGRIAKHKEYLPSRILDRKKIEYFSKGILSCYETWVKKRYLSADQQAHIVYRSNNPRIALNTSNEIVNYRESNNLDDSDLNLIVFDDHGKISKEKNIDKIKGLIYYQRVSGANPTKRLFLNFDQFTAEKRNLALYELTEAALTRILIADERIWEAHASFPRIEDLTRMNVNLVRVNNKKASVADIQSSLVKHSPHFIIIHQGLLDKMNAKEREKIDNMAIKHETTYVIASGRGLPNNLRHRARFLEISALERFINEDDKHGLVQVLYSLRRYSHV